MYVSSGTSAYSRDSGCEDGGSGGVGRWEGGSCKGKKIDRHSLTTHSNSASQIVPVLKECPPLKLDDTNTEGVAV